jgi:hypothetical protein
MGRSPRASCTESENEGLPTDMAIPDPQGQVRTSSSCSHPRGLFIRSPKIRPQNGSVAHASNVYRRRQGQRLTVAVLWSSVPRVRCARKTLSNRNALNGLQKYASQPDARASSSISGPWPVTTITKQSRVLGWVLMRRVAARPPKAGMDKSMRIANGGWRIAACRPSSPFASVVVRYPRQDKQEDQMIRASGSSSMTSKSGGVKWTPLRDIPSRTLLVLNAFGAPMAMTRTRRPHVVARTTPGGGCPTGGGGGPQSTNVGRGKFQRPGGGSDKGATCRRGKPGFGMIGCAHSRLFAFRRRDADDATRG